MHLLGMEEKGQASQLKISECRERTKIYKGRDIVMNINDNPGDYYHMFEIEPDMDLSEIKRAQHKLDQKVNPDKNKSSCATKDAAITNLW